MQIITDIAFNAPVVVGALLVVGWYLYKVMWGVTRLCRGSGRMGGDEEMTESAEELRTSRAGQVRETVRVTVFILFTSFISHSM